MLPRFDLSEANTPKTSLLSRGQTVKPERDLSLKLVRAMLVYSRFDSFLYPGVAYNFRYSMFIWSVCCGSVWCYLKFYRRAVYQSINVKEVFFIIKTNLINVYLIIHIIFAILVLCVLWVFGLGWYDFRSYMFEVALTSMNFIPGHFAVEAALRKSVVYSQ